MKVLLNNNKKQVDSYVGDIILFDGIPCMVVDLGKESDFYGVLAVEGYHAGEIIERFEGLHEIDLDGRATELLIKNDSIIITKEEGERLCQY